MQPPLDTPILFLIFNRPDTTRVVFEQVKLVRPTKLFIAADAPRPHVAGEEEKCKEARSIVTAIDWKCEVHTLFRKKNLGCGLAVSSAITWFFKQVEEGIILEDDCFPDLSFFYYCRQLLTTYRNNTKVMLIGGNNFQNGIQHGQGSYYFTHYPEIWGWAAWRRTWELYDFRMTGLKEAFQSGKFKQVFKTSAETNYWYQKFVDTSLGRNNTWDYQLMFSILNSGGCAISPQVNLVKNIGLENNPTHHSLRDTSKELTTTAMIFPLVHPKMEVDQIADHYTFSRIYSRSVQRMWRLIMENGWKNFTLYFITSVFKSLRNRI